MSSYFFGGFSAYLIVPSGRQSNHSGCSLIQGWSGEHWIAKSIAISSPWSRAARDQPAEVLERAELGMDRVVAALGASRWRRGCRGRPASASSVLLLALAVGLADRVDRREVEHVEAHVAHVGQPARSRRRRCRAGRRRRSASAGTSRTRRRSGRPCRSTTTPARAVARQVGPLGPSRAHRRCALRPTAAAGSAQILVGVVARQRAPASFPSLRGRRRLPAWPQRSTSSRPSSSSSDSFWPASRFLTKSAAPVCEQVAPGARWCRSSGRSA